METSYWTLINTIKKSWASEDAARAVGWSCPAQYNQFGRDFVTRFIMQLESLPDFSFFVRYMTGTTIRKNTKAEITYLNKK